MSNVSITDTRPAQRGRVPGDACQRNPERTYAGKPIGIRTGTVAGYNAHQKAREDACRPCMDAQAALTAARRGSAGDSYGNYQLALREYESRIAAGESLPVCAKPSTAYPDGRTGTRAGFQAHKTISEPACEACREGNKRTYTDERRANPEVVLRGNLYGKYRLSLERYRLILAEQNNCCAICGAESPDDIRLDRFHVDHDHACCPGDTSCGRCIRGLLCRGCNTALGNFRDDPDILLAALSYLLSHGKEVAE